MRYRAAVLVGIAAICVVACDRDGAESKSEKTVAAPAQEEGVGYNVLLITLDTTRADRLGAYGYDKARTPALDSLASRGALFERAYTSCPLTLPAHATMLTGLEPPEHGLRINGGARLGDRVPTLTTVLRSQDYRTAAFVAAFVLDSKFGLDRGFQVYNDDLINAHEQDIPEPYSVHRDGNVVVDAALAWLQEQDSGSAVQGSGAREPAESGQLPRETSNQKPFFAWVHLYDPHYPYFAHPELAGTPFEGQESYDGDIAFMDLQVKRLLDFLDQRGLRERTLVIAVGDHGEGLEEHGEFEHGYLLNEEVLRIPLLISLPGVVQVGARIDATVSSIDLFPTIVDVLGITATKQGQGRSLRPALEGQRIASVPSYAESNMPYTSYGWNPLRSLTTPEWKYIRTTRPELYERPADTREIFNLATARAQQLNEMEAALASFERQLGPRAASERIQLTAKDRERMEALGYSTREQEEPGETEKAAQTGNNDENKGDAAVVGLKDIKEMLGVKHLDTTLFRGMTTGTMSPRVQIETAQELVRRSPETASFHGRLGAAFLNAGQPEDAIAPLSEAFKLDPEVLETEINLGRALARTAKPDEAIPHFRNALAMEPSSVDAHFGIANALVDRGELDTACGHYAEVIRLQPGNADARFNLANTLSRRRKTDLALTQYNEALRLRPDFAAAHFNVANLLAANNDVETAIVHYRIALRLQPGNVDALNNLGVALARQGKRDEAKALYVQAAKMHPRFARAHFNLARELAADRQFGKALAAYGRAVELSPGNTDFALAYARLLATCEETKLRNPQRAVELAESAVQHGNGGDPFALDTLSLAYATAGRRDQARQTAELALRLAQLEKFEALAVEIEARLGGPDAVAKGAGKERVLAMQGVGAQSPNEQPIQRQRTVGPSNVTARDNSASKDQP